MPKLQAIVSNMPFGVGFKQLGEQFDASEKEAEILVALKRARLVKSEAPAKRAETPVATPAASASPAASSTKETELSKADAQPQKPVKQPKPPKPVKPSDKPKRAYNRRDMKAK